MRRVESLLAITDFSIGAHHAVERAAMLAVSRELDRVGLLHVVETSLLDGLKRLFSGSSEADESFEADAKRTLTTLAGEIEAEHGLEIDAMVRSGRPLEAVLEIAPEFELLVVGAVGQHRTRRLALGTTSRALLRAHHQPVLIVRRPPSVPYRRVMVAMDFSEYALRALDWARMLVPEAHLHLESVFDNPSPRSMSYTRGGYEGLDRFRRRLLKRAERRMADLLAELPAGASPLTWSIDPGDPAAVLVEQAESRAADLLVIGRHAKPPAEQLLVGSVTLRVLDRSSCDVLVVQ